MINSQTDEIKSKIDIVDLISEYIQLKQAGANWKACCPFHNEKTPSFMVSREKQIWHCFGCGEGGDAFSFVQKIENMEFPEALRLLAQKAGIKLKKIDPTLTSQRTKLLDINKLAAEYFYQVLFKSQEAQIARDYIKTRQLTKLTIDDFKLGYAPDSWDTLLNFLRKKNYKDNDIFLAGLVVKNDKGKLYDRFRKRLIFPICDNNSNIVGFTARILDQSQESQGGKYINTPQTLIYNKSLIIYGLDKAKKEIKNKDLVVIVEGNMDAITSHQAGIKNVIASSGTALTLEQLKILQRFSNNLALAFDADMAGQVAAQRGIDNALSIGMNIKIIQLPKEINGQEIKDPDDCIKQGVDHWQKAIDNSISIMDFYFKKIFNQYNNDDPQDKKQIADKLLKQIIKINNLVEQDYWLKQLAQKIETDENILRESLKQYLSQDKKNEEEINFEQIKVKSKEEQLAEKILALTIKYSKNLQYVIDHLQIEMIINPDLQKIYKEIILYYNKENKFDYTEIEKKLHTINSGLVNQLATLVLLADKDFLNFNKQQINHEIISMINSLKKSQINKKIKQIQELLIQAEKNNDKNQIEELSKDFSLLTQQLNNL